MRYTIHWKSKLTKAAGHGTAGLTKEAAEKECVRLNIRYPEFEHWFESAVTDSGRK